MWGRTRLKAGAQELLFKEGVKIDVNDIYDVASVREFFPIKKEITFIKMKNGELYTVFQVCVLNNRHGSFSINGLYPVTIKVDIGRWRE